MDQNTVQTTTEPRRWYEVARAQGRSLRWLAQATGISERAIYGYSSLSAQNYRTAPPEWLARVAEVLGEEVVA